MEVLRPDQPKIRSVAGSGGEYTTASDEPPLQCAQDVGIPSRLERLIVAVEAVAAVIAKSSQ